MIMKGDKKKAWLRHNTSRRRRRGSVTILVEVFVFLVQRESFSREALQNERHQNETLIAFCVKVHHQFKERTFAVYGDTSYNTKLAIK